MKRRPFIRRTLAAGLALMAAPPAYLYATKREYVPAVSAYTHNPDLPTLLSAREWPGTPLDQKGLFINHEHPFWPRFSDLWKWQTSPNPYKARKKADTSRVAVQLHGSLSDIPDNSLVWLGHASFLLRLQGKTLLIDPVLESSFFLKRHAALPLDTSHLTGIDYILISHNHRDHCDEDSCKLLARQNPQATWLTGLELDKLLKKWTGSGSIQAAGWYQQYRTLSPGLSVTYLPTRHWSRRGLFDTNTTLWGAFMIEAGGKKIYFGADSGYGSHIGQVRELFGQVDFYLAGVGAFAPRWFMGPAHMHPEEAARSCNDLQPRHLVPMHYGTFDLSDEPLLEPLKLIRELKEEQAFGSNLLVPAVGEVVKV